MSPRRFFLNAFIAISLALFWVVPLTTLGLFRWKPFWIIKDIFYFEEISGLFLHRTPIWEVYYIQVKDSGSESWKYLPEGDLFPMQPFGWRSRFQRYLCDYSKNPAKDLLQLELAKWIHQHVERSGRSIVGVRFVIINIPATSGMVFGGHWSNPPIDSIPSLQSSIVSTYTFPAQ